MGAALLNLGCGAEVHPAFVNVDLIEAPGVVKHDLRQGIPYDDKTYDLVYHSTMLSHLRPADALTLTRDCYRVLKPGGILRIVTEDLEQMCRLYLQKLDAAFAGRLSERLRLRVDDPRTLRSSYTGTARWRWHGRVPHAGSVAERGVRAFQGRGSREGK